MLLFWGGLLLLAAVSAYAVTTYSESATQCPSLLPLRLSSPEPFCDTYLSGRRIVVGVLAALGAVALLAGVTVRLMRLGEAEPPRTGGLVEPRLHGSWALAFLAPVLFIPLGTGYDIVVNVLFIGRTQESFGLPSGWIHLAAPAGAVMVCWWFTGADLTRQSAMAAAAVAIPAMTLVQSLPPLFTRPILDGDTSARIATSGWVLLLSGLPLALAVLGAAWLQSRHFTAPAVGVSLGLGLSSAALTTVVVLPQLLPGLDTADGRGTYAFGGFPSSVWLPLLSGMVLLALLVIGSSYRRARVIQDLAA